MRWQTVCVADPLQLKKKRQILNHSLQGSRLIAASLNIMCNITNRALNTEYSYTKKNNLHNLKTITI